MRVAEIVEHLDAAQRQAAAKPRSDKYKKFYSGRAWRAARYQFLKMQPRPLKCAACGADSTQTRIHCDHIVPIKTEEGWRRRTDLTNFQLLCAEDNRAKASSDQTDWRDNKIEA